MTHEEPCSPLPGIGVEVMVGKWFVCECGRDIGMSECPGKGQCVDVYLGAHKNVGMYPDS